jgi:hypothetical protein
LLPHAARLLQVIADYFSQDMSALRQNAVENVKNIILSRKNTKKIIDEWQAAKEETNKWRLRK